MGARMEQVKEIRYKAYAYLCRTCCTILEIPCFKDGQCPECGSKDKDVLYTQRFISDIDRG